MLKYFKKQKGRRRRNTIDNGSSEGGRTGAGSGSGSGSSAIVKRNSLRSTSSFADEVVFAETTVEGEIDESDDTVSHGSIGLYFPDDDIFKYHSRLSMSLRSIVREPNCLSYFVQYLETRDALSLLKFYLDIENFKAAAMMQTEKDHLQQRNREAQEETKENDDLHVLKRHSQQLALSAPDERLGSPEEDKSDEEKNCVPELKTLCDLSMRRPITDDEKSQIFAETSKQITKCNINKNNNNNSSSHNKLKAGSELSLCCSLSTSSVCGAEDELSLCNGNDCVARVCVKDAMAIYKKYLISDAKQFVSLPVAVLSHISLLLCQNNDDDDIGDAKTTNDQHDNDLLTCFDDAQEYVLEQLEREYLNDFLQSIFYRKYCIELIEGTDMIKGRKRSREEQLNVYDILFSEVTLFLFMEFLEQHNESECLHFWTSAINFRKSYAESNEPAMESEAQADAMVIYEKFFSLKSDCRFWMSDKLRSCVEERICAVGHVAYCFDLPLQVVAKYLERKYFADFLNSQLFENYVNELKSNLHAKNCTTERSAGDRFNSTQNSQRSHRKTLSDCTTEAARELFKHISQQNTLLAMDSSTTTHLKNFHSSGTNLSIDSRHLTDPNLLWHRSISAEGGLKFGHVNSLGRYERDFEAVDTVRNSWSLNLGGNKIKNAMRKLVNLPEEKVQEEIAWQVAEMIVKDVTSITLNTNNGSSNDAAAADGDNKSK